MTPRTFCFTLLSILAASIAANLPAQAQRARVFVSVTGNDANPCTAGSPCKTFQTAYNAVLAGGEISVLDTGGYGTLTIAKALSIVSPAGVEASIAIPSGGTGITISAGSSDKVSLRGLTLDGQGVAGFGIDFVSGQSLTVEDCIVRNMTIDGLDFFSFTSAPQTLTVSNSYFTDNAGSGLVIKTVFTGAVTVSIDKTGFNGNVGNGLLVDGTSGMFGETINVAVTDSVAANNGIGFAVQSGNDRATGNLSLTHSLAAGNGIAGVLAEGSNAALWIAQSTATGNGFGYDALGGGVILSYGDNYLAAGNLSNNGVLGSATKQ